MLRKTTLLTACTLLSHTLYAMPAYVIAPNCLLTNAKLTATTLAVQGDYRFIQTDEDGLTQLTLTKGSHANPCGGFVNVTDAYTASHDATTLLKNTLATLSPTKHTRLAYTIQHQAEVTALLANINPSHIWSNLATFSSSRDRYANNDNGVNAAQFIEERIQAYASAVNRTDITITRIPTPGYKQPSVVVKLGNSTNSGIVLGAHLDTLRANVSVKPGADDDGSGSMSLLEAARVLIQSPLQFNKPIYFIWYAAEEEGLVGSQAVVAQFKKNHTPVDAVMHFDLTGYAYQNDPAMWVMDDYTNPDLTTFTQALINTYIKVPVHHSECGYACSDHASWYQAGFATALPAEAAYENTNPNIHTSEDTIDKLSLSHMANYTKVATAFAVELGDLRK